MTSKGNNQDIPLNKTLHFRRLREVMTELCAYENIDIENYDLFHSTSYRCYGDELKGKNVRTKAVGKNNNYSCFVGNNKYEVIEYPHKNNKKSFTGEFLLLIRNRTFDYWILAKMNHFYDEERSKEVKNFVEKITFNIYGKYYILSSEKDSDIKKMLKGKDCTFGGNVFRYSYFDSFSTRKKAYGISIQQYIGDKKGVKNYNKHAVIDDKTVPRYKKKHRKHKNKLS